MLSPEGYTNLEAGRELSWDEIGHHSSDRYSTIDRHRMMLLEPYNIHINIDQAADMTPILSYRICQIVDCTELTTEGARKLRGGLMFFFSFYFSALNLRFQDCALNQTNIAALMQITVFDQRTQLAKQSNDRSHKSQQEKSPKYFE